MRIESYVNNLLRTHGKDKATAIAANLFHISRMSAQDPQSYPPHADECEWTDNPKGGKKLVIDEIAKAKRIIKMFRFWENVFMTLRKSK
jgi:hypothetical protein